MMFASEEEFDYARRKLSPQLEKILEEKGFIVLNWGDAGWVHFFAKEPFTHPSEMKGMKLFLGAGDATLTQLYKKAGFKPVPISIVDMLPALQTGLVEAFNSVPLAALAFQWFAFAPHMADLHWTFLSGATVIDRRTWMKIPEELRPEILKVSRAASRSLRREIRTLNEDAVRAMVENGLKIHHISPSVEAEWRKIVEDIYPQIRGTIVPADVFDKVKMYRDEFRSSAGPGRAMTR
jgi:TRAP-type C4-dicarboxylate transport system substrate-binding protein